MLSIESSQPHDIEREEVTGTMSTHANLNHTRALSAATSKHGVVLGFLIYLLALVRLGA